MATQEVPASTKISRKSLKNVDDARLLRRLEWLRDHLGSSREWAEQKNDFKTIVIQVILLERELDRRGIEHVRVTRGTLPDSPYVPRKSLRGRVV